MNKEQQDKLWNELSEEDKAHYREQYAEQKTMSESGVPKLLEELFGSHNLNPKPLTYEDVMKELFLDKDYWIYSSANNNIQRDVSPINRPINSTSREQIEKLLAINKLLNVAKYLNGDWKPDWNDEDKEKIGLYYDGKKDVIKTIREYNYCHAPAYFRTEELAQQAIQILGEETIRLALTTDY